MKQHLIVLLALAMGLVVLAALCYAVILAATLLIIRLIGIA